MISTNISRKAKREEPIVDRREYASDEYDRMFEAGGHEGVYGLPYRHSCYFPLFRRVLAELERRQARTVLEVGCGTGGFAHYVLQESRLQYTGFDFSRSAVELARRRTGRTDLLFVADARDASSYEKPHDAVVCTEVLEHIEADLEVVARWRPGVTCVCSVPNFDADNHVRFFRDERQVRERYGDLMDIDVVARVRKPELTDISLRSYLRELRWNRYRPRRLAEILGMTSFDKGGGWFLFAGRRKS
jgi:2-polyprenyl-3-methyl-5-hydroxy-6-metoxy-1,4-benzoquinol methylase